MNRVRGFPFTVHCDSFSHSQTFLTADLISSLPCFREAWASCHLYVMPLPTPSQLPGFYVLFSIVNFMSLLILEGEAHPPSVLCNCLISPLECILSEGRKLYLTIASPAFSRDLIHNKCLANGYVCWMYVLIGNAELSDLIHVFEKS